MIRIAVIPAIVLAALTILGGVSCETPESSVTLEIRRAEPEPGPGLTKMVFSGWGHADTFYVADEVLLSNADVDSAAVVAWGESRAVEVVFTARGRERFGQVTAEHLGSHLGILVDGQLISAPVVKDTITGGRAVISGDFSEAEAQRIARGIQGP